MGYLTERANYLRGLLDGMQIDKTTEEGRLFKAIVDLLDDIAVSIDDINETEDEFIANMEDYDNRLGDVESQMECLLSDDYDDDDDDDDEDFVCPDCGAEITEDDIVDNGDTVTIHCPKCDKEVTLEWDDECDGECDCCDCCGHED